MDYTRNLAAGLVLLVLSLSTSSLSAGEERPNLAWLGWLHLPAMAPRKPAPDMNVKKMELWMQWSAEDPGHVDWLPENKDTRRRAISIFPQLSESVTFTTAAEKDKKQTVVKPSQRERRAKAP